MIGCRVRDGGFLCGESQLADRTWALVDYLVREAPFTLHPQSKPLNSKPSTPNPSRIEFQTICDSFRPLKRGVVRRCTWGTRASTAATLSTPSLLSRYLILFITLEPRVE